MAGRNLTAQNILGDIRRSNNFVLTINDLEGDAAESLSLIIQQAFLPQVSLNVLEIRHGNDSIKLAGVASWQGGTVTILDVLSRKELNAVLAWFKQTYNPKTREIGIASEYKKAGTIAEMAPNGRFIRKWNVQGMWISDLNLGTLDAASGEHKTITLTIQIDPMNDLAPEYTDYTDDIDN